MAEKLFEYSPEEAIGKTVKEIYTKEKVLLEHFGKSIEYIRHCGELLYTVKKETKDGARNIDMRISGIYDFKKELIGYVLFAKERERNERLPIDERIYADIENKNIAIREMLRQIEVAKGDMKKEVMLNLETMTFPLIQKLKQKEDTDNATLNLLEKSLQGLTSDFGMKISNKTLKLTPKEIEICAMVKSGFSNKEIASEFTLSIKTVETHRRTIRHKLGIVNKDINLATFLNKL